ncbi:GNAT family N-acetyltransferase [Streptomyces sp. 8K308]|uniref:GNAT family N-acetyltransferase n=1 Tax=Streptomyces sp. 8K308 TaxID=2530388 RepID=UPI0010524AD3|nr:GNAT family N-acetyltransferase [Streptomyces sp. 8K308]TDC27287.1 GNAT family N-acetyltransferase [Streptomyces sp. 8K308]
MGLEIRDVADSAADQDAWFRAVYTGFLTAEPPSEEQLAERRVHSDMSRAQGAFDGDRCVATFRSFDQELTVPGGGVVRADAVSGVTVTATHRRRGLLSRMMAADLAAAKERGDVVATLAAAEFRIYGRFGFGPAARSVEWRVEKPLAALDPRWTLPEAEGTVAFVDGAEARKEGPGLHERFRRTRAGAVDNVPMYWERLTGALRWGPDTWKEPFYVLFRDPAGQAQGIAIFEVQDAWRDAQPANVAKVRKLFAATPAAERALWRLLLSVDWVTEVRTGDEGDPDALLPLLLPNQRAATTISDADLLWVRPLDVPGMLTARRYSASGALVLDIRDPLGLSEGRYLLEASEAGASCVPTTRSADLTLDTGALSALYLGDASAARLTDAGLVDVHTDGAPARADALFRTGRRPWCPDVF